MVQRLSHTGSIGGCGVRSVTAGSVRPLEVEMSKIELRMQPHLNYHRVGARPCTAPQSYQAFYIAAESEFALSSPLPTTTSASLVCRPGGHPSWAIFTQQQTLQQRSRPRLGAEHAHKRFWRTDLSSLPSTRTQSFLFMYLLFTGHPS